MTEFNNGYLESFDEMNRMNSEITQFARTLGIDFTKDIGGMAPVQGEGTYEGNPCYFRMRGGAASLQVWKNRGWDIEFYPTFLDDCILSSRIVVGKNRYQGIFKDAAQGKEVMSALVRDLAPPENSRAFMAGERREDSPRESDITPLFSGWIDVVDRSDGWSRSPSILLSVGDTVAHHYWSMMDENSADIRVTTTVEMVRDIGYIGHSVQELSRRFTPDEPATVEVIYDAIMSNMSSIVNSVSCHESDMAYSFNRSISLRTARLFHEGLLRSGVDLRMQRGSIDSIL